MGERWRVVGKREEGIRKQREVIYKKGTTNVGVGREGKGREKEGRKGDVKEN